MWWLSFLAALALGLIFFISGTLFLIRQALRKRKGIDKSRDGRFTVGIFHPYCNKGGGKERVLWSILIALQERYPDHRNVIYTGDTDMSPEQLLETARSKYNLRPKLTGLEFIYLHRRSWIETSKYSVLKRLGQLFGTVVLGLEAGLKCVPDVFLETDGFGLTLPLFKYLGGSRTGTYLHHLPVSPDLLHLPTGGSSGRYSGNGSPGGIGTPFVHFGTVVYLRLIVWIHGLGAKAAEVIMTNSSWTEAHVNHEWGIVGRTLKVFPPVPVDDLSKLLLEDHDPQGHIKIISVGPFRVEKDHPQQLRTMFQLRQILREEEWDCVQLVLIGTCMSPQENTRVQDMEDLCRHLSLEKNVTFRVNVSYEEIREELGGAILALHTTWNEAFGIEVAESMAAGVIVVASGSGGPLMDLVMEHRVCRNGYLAFDELDYAEAIRTVIRMRPDARRIIQTQGRAAVQRFSEAEFQRTFLEAVHCLFH